MDNIEHLLDEEIQSQFKAIADLDIESAEYKAGLDSIAKLMDKRNDLTRIQMEAKEKAKSREDDKALRLKQLENEKKDRRIGHGIAIGGIVLPLLLTIWGTKKSLKFEETGTVTTSIGKGFINRLLPKK